MKRLLSLVLFVVLLTGGCAKTPPNLTPEAQVAFHATRVITVLDVVRDAAIAANSVTPPLISTEDTRKIVLWHQTAVQTIAASPAGWKPAVKAGIYALTCEPLAASPTSPQPCVAQLPAEVVTRLSPYISLALVVIAEVF